MQYRAQASACVPAQSKLRWTAVTTGEVFALRTLFNARAYRRLATTVTSVMPQSI